MTTLSPPAWLFVPGDRPERFAKAVASGAGEVVVDLEDAVADEHKAAARAAATEWLGGHGQAWVRINAPGTRWFAEDIAAIARTPGLRGVMVPKAEDAGELETIGHRLGGERGIVALVETAAGVHRAYELAACRAVRQLAFGSIDFAIDIGATEADEPLLLARSTLVLASRVGGLPAPLDGVSVQIRDSAAVTTAARRARALGFGGKLCIHPAQVAAVTAAFRPNEDEIAWARGVAAAAEGTGAAQFEGQMVDKPVLARARQILARVSG